ncbi:hypothetical protein CAEBREN_15873 [Caenorhabditis brenneri]|uniref:Sdz-33 F-box domain-containing protein n=1 Tax=Caenorhabditis brenneri TaxID=135651 RepID=G0N2K6_CAEBE|nr:hypothetical protein CAEBREN_15873 [Caenorhabditis brenneri]
MGFIREIIKRQQQIKELRMYGDVPDEDITWIMENLKVTDKLLISRHGQNFPYEFQQLPCKLIIFDAFWFTLENLLHLGTCKLLRLSGSHLTNGDIAQFIDHWKSGELPELEYFQMDYMHRMSEAMPIGELAVFTASTGYRDKEITGETVSIFNGIEIDGKDGRAKALLSFTRDTQKFQFFVCRDTDFVRGRVV